jgi:hypothetical protein
LLTHIGTGAESRDQPEPLLAFTQLALGVWRAVTLVAGDEDRALAASRIG